MTSRALRYGMGLFETCLVVEGRVIDAAPHLDSLRAAATQAGFELSESTTPGASSLPPCVGTGILRLFLLATSGGPGSPPGLPECRALFEPRPLTDPAKYRSGFVVHPPIVSARTFHPGLKLLSYWSNLDALARARQAGCDEAVLVNTEEQIAGACLGNLFLLINGKWRTPLPADGARAGVVRGWVLEQTGGLAETLHADSLRIATEAIITNSGHGIMPVARLGDRPLEMSEGLFLSETWLRQIAGVS